ncbi:hypothetical protein G8759_11070 [Spirosoma aureum]|uniref:Uncharacterized protein n=1 Tax=Spirosoma aureum TaxID=2692134 RepID=A0A6G9AKZ9_9BACT|nr:hypothetical protein [Spirosoma aureum]QIP13127.1 hypothetical protein G8759_11070 [Spirosoma aureum]
MRATVITDAQINRGTHLSESPIIVWFVCCQSGYDISPLPIVEQDGVIFILTDNVRYAVYRQTRPISWAYKLSSSMVNRVFLLKNLKYQSARWMAK